MTQPPTHPEYSDVRGRPDTIQQLHELPDRVAEAMVTAYAPNPSGRAPRTGRADGATAHPPAPANLDLIDALAPDPDGTRRNVVGLIAQAVRAVWEDHPTLPLDDQPTLLGDCRWLITHHHHWQPDPFLAAFVADAVHAAHRELERLCRVPQRIRYRCPVCGCEMTLQSGDWFLCAAGHEHPGPVRLEQQWRRRPKMTTPEIIATFADDLHVTLTDERIRQWATRRRLPRAGKDDRGRSLWLPWDVMRCLMPEVVDALDARWERSTAM